MTNEQIRQRCTRIVHAYMKSAQPQTKTDEQFIEDVAELAINVLVNLNTIAGQTP